MTARSFVDTNVLAYIYERFDVRKREIAAALVTDLLADESLAISTQVLTELCAVLLKPAFGMSTESVARVLRTFEGIELVQSDSALLLRGLDARARYQVSIWDGLIIAAAERARCHEILTEDLSHGQTYFGVVARNPFFSAVSEA
jgi:predicted nucleic acid-binding protein